MARLAAKNQRFWRRGGRGRGLRSAAARDERQEKRLWADPLVGGRESGAAVWGLERDGWRSASPLRLSELGRGDGCGFAVDLLWAPGAPRAPCGLSPPPAHARSRRCDDRKTGWTAHQNAHHTPLCSCRLHLQTRPSSANLPSVEHCPRAPRLQGCLITSSTPDAIIMPTAPHASVRTPRPTSTTSTVSSIVIHPVSIPRPSRPRTPIAT